MCIEISYHLHMFLFLINRNVHKDTAFTLFNIWDPILFTVIFKENIAMLRYYFHFFYLNKIFLRQNLKNCFKM